MQQRGGVLMPITSRLPPKSSFDPETIALLTGAFEDAWRSLNRGDGIGPDTDAIREMLAKHIITTAQTGERDVIRLRDGAVAYVMGALQRIEAMRQSSVREPSRSQMPAPPAAR
jgi:hypothetical protein